MTGPLAGIRVIDLTRVLAGPWAGQLLGDYGADVLKVERPASGDDTRRWGPPWLRNGAGEELDDAAYFLAANRNKRSITCNLSHVDGAAVARELIRNADVILENFRPGTLERYGLGIASLQELNPRLICCTISAYGRSSSRSNEPGYDAMIQASAGLMSVTGESELNGGRPQKVGVAIADIMAGMYAATAVLAALSERHDTGRGSRIEVPLFDSQVAWLANQAMNYLIGGQVPERYGNGHPNIVPYQTFPTADGELMLAVGTDRQFAVCMRLIGLSDLADDPRYATNPERLRHRESLVRAMSDRLSTETTGYWLDSFRDAGIPAGPVRDLAGVFGDAYVAERGLVAHPAHATAGPIPSVINPVRFDNKACRAELAPPVLGEHTNEVLRHELGYSSEEIEALRASGAI